MSLITLLSDFGPGKYVAAMKGVILSINPEARIVDIDHDVSPQNVLEGSFALASAVNYFPEALHVAVVDPGVGSSRRPLVVECERGLLVGPDNGLLFPAAQVLGFEGAFEVKEEKYCLPKASSTFHGRDVFAPVAAHLSLGVAPESVGPPVRDMMELHFGTYHVSELEVKGEVVFEDRFGNLITNVPAEALPTWLAPGRTAEVELADTRELPFHQNYASGEEGEPLLTISSDGFLEIAVNRGRASNLLQARQGSTFTARKPRPGKA